jgi:hypothetical protein
MLHSLLTLLLIAAFWPFQTNESLKPFENKGIYSQVEAENPIFQNIKVSGGKGEYHISGEARPMSGEFFYMIEDGHNELETIKRVKTDFSYPAWSDFQLNVKVKAPLKGTLTLCLFEKGANEKIIHFLPIVLEKS